MSYPTSRKFPRSLQQAFPADYAAAIERSHRRQYRFVSAVCVLAFVVMGAILLVERFA